MSKTIRNGSDFPNRSNADPRKTPEPYPPVDPVVAQNKQKER